MSDATQTDIQIITRLPVERWREYRELRLRALKTDPQAFGQLVGIPRRVLRAAARQFDRILNKRNPDRTRLNLPAPSRRRVCGAGWSR